MPNILKTGTLFFVGIIIVVLINFSGFFSPEDSPLKKVAELAEELDESSGLIYTPKGLFTLNDSKKPEFYRIDTATGEILQTISIHDIDFDDKESISFDGEYIYIGDFGNNDGDRKNLKIVKIDYSDISEKKDLSVNGEIIQFHYPEQQTFDMKKKDNAFDSEAMVVAADSIYVFTKQRNNHQTTLYSLPKKTGNYAATKNAAFDVNGRITSAALNPEQNTLLLLGYQDDHQFPFLWKFLDFSGNNFFSGNSSSVKISTSPLDWQTEGMTFKDENEIFISCETTGDVKASLYSGNLQEMFSKN
ncbi:MAG: hypothetical protein WD059_00980 [Balneolaceae bacterium]